LWCSSQCSGIHAHQAHELIASRTIKFLDGGKNTILILLLSGELPLLSFWICIIESGRVSSTIRVPESFPGRIIEWCKRGFAGFLSATLDGEGSFTGWFVDCVTCRIQSLPDGELAINVPGRFLSASHHEPRVKCILHMM
jgi:hypothetical protein